MAGNEVKLANTKMFFEYIKNNKYLNNYFLDLISYLCMEHTHTHTHKHAYIYI